MSRSWEIYGPLGHDDTKVHETDLQTRMEHWESLKRYVDTNFSECDNRDLYKQAWEDLWPESVDEVDWVHKWHGFPLYNNSSL
jgi:hypothetical protein